MYTEKSLEELLAIADAMKVEDADANEMYEDATLEELFNLFDARYEASVKD